MSERAARRHSDIYIVGAANVGKSTFLNQILELHNNAGGRGRGRKGASSSSRNRGVTTSPLPGTTLDFLCIDLNARWRRNKGGRGGLLYDTPGLIMPHQLTARLTTEELSAVVPTRRVHHTTLRVAVGKSVLLGGLMRVDVLDDRLDDEEGRVSKSRDKPGFFLTFFVADSVVRRARDPPSLLRSEQPLLPPQVKLHPTATERAEKSERSWRGRSCSRRPSRANGSASWANSRVTS